MSGLKIRRISCDASVRGEFSGIAGVLEGRDPRVLFLHVMRGRSSPRAERAALEKAMQMARSNGWKDVVFRTDAEGIKVHCKMLPGWRLEYISRRHNVAAHVCARQALTLWEAAQSGEPTFSIDSLSPPAVRVTDDERSKSPTSTSSASPAAEAA